MEKRSQRTKNVSTIHILFTKAKSTRLCNACGLKWAKKRRMEEKRATPFVDGNAPAVPDSTTESVELPSLPVLKVDKVEPK